MKSGSGEIYSVYLMYFVNSIRLASFWFLRFQFILIQISRKASTKSDLDEIAFIQNHTNVKKNDNKMLTSSN